MALPDLDVRSVLSVVEENFQKLALKAYAIRMIYIGEHTLKKDEIIQKFHKTIQAVNASYCEINVRGLLLVYDSYFVHVIEGSEDTVYRQLRFLFKFESDWIEEMNRLDDEAAQAAVAAAEEAAAEGITVILEDDSHQRPERKIFRRLKMLMVYHSIKTPIFEEWEAVTAHPPSLIGKLDVFGPLAEHMEQLRICLDKINRLCELAKSDEPLSFEGLTAVDAKMDALPEVGLLDYLLQSQHILDLHQVAHLHRRVDDYCFYFENVWPLPTHFTPRHLYKLKIDDSFVEPLPVMPWEHVKETTEDEERQEQSGSSSSD
ncbi:uncharacterized protein LOC131848302 [Achroia grisella]|uniref:uncharacterized protein LOC131848302 n=1 Tax=Achroia grisella TaxID=688607 RepID=UPI0027D27804|nr:uncharacterized protein LOC131848302 [Achroia grisella]